jgi:hypothetical protein
VGGEQSAPQKGSPSATQSAGGKTSKEVSPDAFRAALAIAQILVNLSKKDQLSAMQMAGVQAGLSVETKFAAEAAVERRAKASAGSADKPARPAGPATAQRKWGPEVKAQQAKISKLTADIKSASAALGENLPKDHELCLARDAAFRELKALKSGGGASS